MGSPDNSKWYKRYQALLKENLKLKARIKELEKPDDNLSSHDSIGEITLIQEPVKNFSLEETIDNLSDPNRKIDFFISLFKGREDVHAKRWESQKGNSGYSPVCLNEWVSGKCRKPKIKCSKCLNRSYSPLSRVAIDSHLRGKAVLGVYPLCQDETCSFLALDFDKEEWKKDVSAFRHVCQELNIPIAVERSRSGNGCHAWFFFDEKIPATVARKFGTALLTHAMNQRHEITFSSYDRLFPNQDTLPKGGLGNLIALPLQMGPRKHGNSVFVDENFIPYPDQWRFLSGIQKLNLKTLSKVISKLCQGNELGPLKKEEPGTEAEVNKPWVKTIIRWTKEDFPKTIEIVKSNMIYLPKKEFSPRALNQLKRFAAFQNPEFYKAQAMRLPTYKKNRVLSCFQEFDHYIGLPRGCENDLNDFLNEQKIKIQWKDETNHGRPIDVEFNGLLRPQQQLAVEELLNHENGVLSASTAFGKTVVGASLIAQRKVNTLIIVHRQQLLSQWIKRLSEFLIIRTIPPEPGPEKGQKKKKSPLGQLAGGKIQLNSIVDVAMMQSLNKVGNIRECVENYGMIIVDECHHVPALSFEQILCKSTAKYVYGLTATPMRQDGHHPIIFFHCGPVRFQVNAKEQAANRPFDHYIIPRFTSFRLPLQKDDDRKSIQEIYRELIEDELRNQQIVDDIIDCHKKAKNILVLTGRVAHVEELANRLKQKIPHLIALTGGMGAKQTQKELEKISQVPMNSPITLISTGKFIGEGFDEPRLDTLFLAMPVAWKGTLHQYAGRLHRLWDNKNEVIIYDYVDVHVPVLERMYGKRVKGYAAIGYRAKVENIDGPPRDIIFDNLSFLPVYLRDMDHARRDILIVTPFVTARRVAQMMECFAPILANQLPITIVTRPAASFPPRQKDQLTLIFKKLTDAGIMLIFKPDIHQKFAIIDQKIVWYGSINLLGFGNSQESIMRLISANIAQELSRTIPQINLP